MPAAFRWLRARWRRFGDNWRQMKGPERMNFGVSTFIGIVGLILSWQQYNLARVQQAVLDDERSRRADLYLAVERSDIVGDEIYDIVVRNAGRKSPERWAWQLTLPEPLAQVMDIHIYEDGMPSRQDISNPPEKTVWLVWSVAPDHPVFSTLPYVVGRIRLKPGANKDAVLFGWTINSEDGEFPPGNVPGYARLPK